MNLKPVKGTPVDMSESSIREVKKQLAKMFSGGEAGKMDVMQVTDKERRRAFDYHIKTLSN